MWDSAAERREFGAIWPLWYSEDRAARDRRSAVERLRALAEGGYAPAQFALAMAYFDGEGARRDYSLCFRHCLAAAEQDYPSAAGMMGNFYASVRPHYGVCEHDVAHAAQWWRRAAEKGNHAAQFNLATAYVTGDGLEKSDVDAFVWASVAVHCSPIRFRPAEAVRDRIGAELDAARRAAAEVRVAQLNARLPLPWSEHIVYWKSLAAAEGALDLPKSG